MGPLVLAKVSAIRITSGVPQGSVFCPLLFLTYINYIWRNIGSTIRLFADDCIIYRKIIYNKDMEHLQLDVNRLGEWAAETEMIINPAKSKAVCFTRTRVTELLNYSLRDIVIPEASRYKCLGTILRSDLSWADQVNLTVKEPRRHFILQCVF
jgi:hypothetical protein